MGPTRPRRASTPRSCRPERAVCGVFHGEESVHRRLNETAGMCCPRGDRATWMPSWVRTRSGCELDRQHDDGSEDGGGDHPAPRRVQPATVRTLPRAGSVRRVNRWRVVWVAERAVVPVGCCCVLLGLERAHDLLGGRCGASGTVGCPAAVEFLPVLELRERRAVDGEIVGEAERERGKVLLWVAGGGQERRGRHSLALFAASASVLEGPQAVGALGDWPFPSSAVVSHHGHPNRELYHHHLALDCSRDG